MKNILTLIILTQLLLGCSQPKPSGVELYEHQILQIENDSLKAVINKNMLNSKTQIATFLTFQDNRAEEAMNFYMGLFDNSKIVKIQRWGNEAPGEEGTIMHAIFELDGNLFMCSDSPPIHEWGFTPAVSNYIDCEDEGELEGLFGKLSENGMVMMPLNNYGFSQKFGFVQDQFGISWQLNLK